MSLPNKTEILRRLSVVNANIMEILEKALMSVDAPIGEHWGCGFLTTQNIKDILDFVKQQDTEINILIRKKETLKDEIDELRAVAEKERAGWILHLDGSGTCERCGRTQKAVWDFDNIQNYCGKCGAKMNGGKNE